MSEKKHIGFAQPLITLDKIVNHMDPLKTAIVGDSHHTISKDNYQMHQSVILQQELNNKGFINNYTHWEHQDIH